MANIALQRIKREFKEVTTCEEAVTTGVKVETTGDNLMRLRGEIRGPPDTPYAGGVYKLEIEIPDNYPFQPPKIKFMTRIWHPNISSATGAICLDVLKDQWAASMTLRTVLLSIQALLCSPEPNDPQDAVVAKQSIENPSLFNQTAQAALDLFLIPLLSLLGFFLFSQRCLESRFPKENGSDDGIGSDENPREMEKSTENATAKSTTFTTMTRTTTMAAIDDTMHMPTTAQLMEVMRHINPFEQKFREANEAMKASEFSQILGSLSASSSVIEQSPVYVEPTAALSTVLRAATSSSTSRGPNNALRLKLPGDSTAITAALTGVRALLNPDGGGSGCGLDTPDIARLVTQMKEESRAAPLTADVLKTVLEIRETFDLQKKRLAELAQQQRAAPLNDQAVSTTTSSQLSNQDRAAAASSGSVRNVTSEMQQHDIGPCDSLLSNDLDTRRLSSSPPALAGIQESPHPSVLVLNRVPSIQEQQVQQPQTPKPQAPPMSAPAAPFATSQASVSYPIAHSRSGDDVIIALKIGDQAVQIPVKINVSAVASSADNAITLMSAPPTVVRGSKRPSSIISRSGASLPAVAPKLILGNASVSSAANAITISQGQSVIYSTSVFSQPPVEPVYEVKPESGLIQGADGEDDEFRKREVLERNKQAACRYRKRKKEEVSHLHDKLKQSETEKLELSTQVQVLRMELERLRNILDLHKDCPVALEQRKKQKKMDYHLSFEHHAPLFHSLVTSSGVGDEESNSRSITPIEQQEGSNTVGPSSGKHSDPTVGGLAGIRLAAAAAAGASLGGKKRPDGPASILISLPHQSNIFTAATAAGQLVQYVALPSSNPQVSPSMTRGEGQINTGQPNFYLQPVLMPGGQTAMVLPAGTSSPLIFPTIVKMNATNTTNGGN